MRVNRKVPPSNKRQTKGNFATNSVNFQHECKLFQRFDGTTKVPTTGVANQNWHTENYQFHTFGANCSFREQKCKSRAVFYFSVFCFLKKKNLLDGLFVGSCIGWKIVVRAVPIIWAIVLFLEPLLQEQNPPTSSTSTLSNTVHKWMNLQTEEHAPNETFTRHNGTYLWLTSCDKTFFITRISSQLCSVDLQRKKQLEKKYFTLESKNNAHAFHSTFLACPGSHCHPFLGRK